jgi:hypothetical protein
MPSQQDNFACFVDSNTKSTWSVRFADREQLMRMAQHVALAKMAVAGNKALVMQGRNSPIFLQFFYLFSKLLLNFF